MLSIRGIGKTYPSKVRALEAIDLEIPVGIFGLLGPNGAGKTTLMKIAAGLLEPSCGSIRFGDLDVVAAPERLWPQLGYLPQDFGFYPHLTGEAMLRYLLELKGVAPAHARELLERVNLGDAAKRKVSEYSGGMRQRLGLAQAVAGDPQLIILDEPTVGLDVEERLRFFRLLARLGQDRTVLLSTHRFDDIQALCREFAVVRAGRLVQRTSPSAAREAIAGTIFEGHLDFDELDAFGERYFVTHALPFEGRNRVRIHLREGEAPPGFVPAAPTLEDAYLILMGAAAA